MFYRIFLQIDHIFLQKSRNNLDCAVQHPHVPSAYVGRPARQDDLEEPFCDEEACSRVEIVSGSELPDFSPNIQRTCESLEGALLR